MLLTVSQEDAISKHTISWLKRLVTMAQEQQQVQFAEVTPLRPVRSGNVAVTVRIAGAEADICNGADTVTVESVLRILKSC